MLQVKHRTRRGVGLLAITSLLAVSLFVVQAQRTEGGADRVSFQVEERRSPPGQELPPDPVSIRTATRTLEDAFARGRFDSLRARLLEVPADYPFDPQEGIPYPRFNIEGEGPADLLKAIQTNRFGVDPFRDYRRIRLGSAQRIYPSLKSMIEQYRILREIATSAYASASKGAVESPVGGVWFTDESDAEQFGRYLFADTQGARKRLWGIISTSLDRHAVYLIDPKDHPDVYHRRMDLQRMSEMLHEQVYTQLVLEQGTQPDVQGVERVR